MRGILILGSLLLLTVGAVGLRNYQLELGSRALNDEKGAVAVKRFELLAELGDSKAQYLLGNIYAFGWAGTLKDDDKAIYWFRRAAMFTKGEADSAAPAELEVAKSYAAGNDGATVNKEESMKWLLRAANGGNKEAASLLTKDKQ